MYPTRTLFLPCLGSFARRKVFSCILACVVVLGISNFRHPAHAADEKWKAEMIADALLAAPPSVTANAKIYAWTDKGELTLVRDGNGPYTCVASGSFSVRVGKPPLPYPDPMCMDSNGWAFLGAVWLRKLRSHRQSPIQIRQVWSGCLGHERRQGRCSLRSR